MRVQFGIAFGQLGFHGPEPGAHRLDLSFQPLHAFRIRLAQRLETLDIGTCCGEIIFERDGPGLDFFPGVIGLSLQAGLNFA